MDERTIFDRALDLDDPEERVAYLDEACGQEAELRSRVEALLRSHEQVSGFLQGAAACTAATIDQPLTEKSGTVIGRYKLLQQVGEGGMGVVFMAEQTEPVERRVALKVIKPGMDTRQVIARFEAERQALAMMDHPNISKVLDAGTTESGRPYFVMELVKGVPIVKYCDQQHLTPKERLELFLPICQAIQHAHQKGIIHRDIKPSNILVAHYDGRPVPKVIDFGVAKAINQRLTEKTMFTQLGQIVGTLEYMSPEQAELNQLDIDTRSDVYSLGVLLYELLTGTTPFDAQRLHSAAFDELLRIIREEEPPKPSTRLSATDELPSIAAQRMTEPKKLSTLVRGDLDWIVMKALEKDRTRRYETATSFSADIERYLSDEPVQACPPSAAYRFKKFALRNKVVIGAAAAVAAALILGVIGTTWQAFRAEKALADMKIAHGNEQQQRIVARKAEKQAIDLAAQTRGLAERNYRLLYISDMNRAQQDWSDANIASVLHLLDRHRPRPGQKDLRSFEWYYLGEQCRRGVLTPELELSTRTFCLDYSRDGRLLATGGQDLMVRIWDANNHQLLHELGGHPHWVHAVAFSPDGTILASGDRKGALKLWNTKTGKLLRTLDKHPGQVGALAFSMDGNILASNWLQTIKLWDVPSGRQLASLQGHKNYVGGISFSPDGEVLASRGGGVLALPGGGGQVKLWDIATHKERTTLPGQLGAGGRIACSPDGKHLAAGTRKGEIFLWDLAETKLRQIITGHTASINSISFSPDGKTFASGSLDQTAKVWDLATGQLLDTLKGHSGSIHALAFSFDNRTLATAGIDGTIKLWDLAKKAPSESFKAHTYGGAALAISSDGKRIASSGSEQNIKLWNAATGQLQTTFGGETGWINSLAFSPDGNTLASVGTAKTVKLWKSHTGELQTALTGHTAEVMDVSFSPDGATLASCSADNTVILWDVGTARQQLSINAQRIRVLRFSPDGKTLVTASLDQELKLWSLPSGTLRKTLVGPTGELYSLAISPDGKTIASGGENVINLWDMTSGSLLKTINAHAARVSGLAFTPDGKTLISGSRDQTVKIWDLQTCDSRITWKPRQGRIHKIALSSDGRTLTAAASGSGFIELWRAATEEEIQPLFRKLEPSSE